MFPEIEISSSNIAKIFWKRNFVVLILKIFFKFLKRMLFLYFRKRNSALFTSSSRNKKIHSRKIYPRKILQKTEASKKLFIFFSKESCSYVLWSNFQSSKKEKIPLLKHWFYYCFSIIFILFFVRYFVFVFVKHECCGLQRAFFNSQAFFTLHSNIWHNLYLPMFSWGWQFHLEVFWASQWGSKHWLGQFVCFNHTVFSKTY